MLTQSNLLWAAADNRAVVTFSNGGMKFTAAYRAGIFPVGHCSGPSKLSVGPARIDDWKCLVMVHCRLEILPSIFAVGMTNHTPPSKKKKKCKLTIWFVTNSSVRSVTLGSVSVKGQGGKGSGFLALVCACFVSHKLHRP